jgi:hypothetical protein
MAKVFGELLFALVRILVVDLMRQGAVKFCAWLDTKVPGRTPRIILGGLLGIAVYFLLPTMLGILGL